MHKNNVMMDWDDVYQEIWKKIIKCRHTWNESKGTMVSTWITIVANSVINTLRQNVNKYNSRYCLYDDLCSSSNEENDTDRMKYDYVQYLQNEQNLLDKSFDEQMWKEKYYEFLYSLNDCEKVFLKVANNMQEDFLKAYDNEKRLPLNKLKLKLGYDDSTYNMIVYNIRKKYCDIFDKKFLSLNNDKNDDDKN